MPAPDYRGTPEGLTDGLTAAWRERVDLTSPVGYEAMVDALRTLLDHIAGSRPPAQLVEEATRQLTELTRQFGKWQVDERGQVFGRLTDVPGRGQVMAPEIAVDEHTSDRATGHVTFGRFYLGGNGAVHGGAIPLAFDELMGRLANTCMSTTGASLRSKRRSASRRTSLLRKAASGFCAASSATGTRSAPMPRACSSRSAPASRDPRFHGVWR
jgi:hypothetical protein